MVFKPWTERAPRHTFEDITDQLVSQPLPKIQLNLATQISGTTIIIPNTLSFINDSLLKLFPENTKIGTVSIYKFLTKNDENQDEYLEDEQLYKSQKQDQLIEEFDQELYIYKLNNELNLLLVPNFQNVIYYNLISKEILSKTTDILTITPGNLSFDQSIAILGSSYPDTKFPYLQPPFHITGISGSLLSKSSKVKGLILKSEGVSGFEKIDKESIENLSYYLQKQFKFNEEFLKFIRNSLKNHNSSNNFGLYL
ncbi:Proteasome chaperone 1 [Wickerhamomyces ciferrii]|uniref:Proteasome chaperone 1 n=1 Tax=Wickerhamomyces ciferrii (strain ATCC 14091 / BCRC 22168 / CBS 111 / JCM 3599 / NBRC 0793 / NRRL Y-1031 F-60-10) TaxID=1206466 RepID=K0KJR2_WICCF|nr:Proteasome chaperone 1 [Wickerhamomyces ciferrii]CCH41333.1 Proteasome chaperone 1 [Wickerhamomyces ciferrii]